MQKPEQKRQQQLQNKQNADANNFAALFVCTSSAYVCVCERECVPLLFLPLPVLPWQQQQQQQRQSPLFLFLLPTLCCFQFPVLRSVLTFCYIALQQSRSCSCYCCRRCCCCSSYFAIMSAVLDCCCCSVYVRFFGLSLFFLLELLFVVVCLCCCCCCSCGALRCVQLPGRCACECFMYYAREWESVWAEHVA